MVAVLGNLGVLVYFKYANFLIDTINQIASFGIAELSVGDVLPLGISYYIFKIISYEIDVYTGKITSEKNLITFSCYCLLYTSDVYKRQVINSTSLKSNGMSR